MPDLGTPFDLRLTVSAGELIGFKRTVLLEAHFCVWCRYVTASSRERTSENVRCAPSVACLHLYCAT